MINVVLCWCYVNADSIFTKVVINCAIIIVNVFTGVFALEFFVCVVLLVIPVILLVRVFCSRFFVVISGEGL